MNFLKNIMEKKTKDKKAKDISKYFILDELAYIEGGYVLPPTNINVDMKKIRELRKNKNQKATIN